jgi:hypothetical protein
VKLSPTEYTRRMFVAVSDIERVVYQLHTGIIPPFPQQGTTPSHNIRWTPRFQAGVPPTEKGSRPYTTKDIVKYLGKTNSEKLIYLVAMEQLAAVEAGDITPDDVVAIH